MKTYTMVNECVPIVSNSLKVMHAVIETCVMRTNNNEAEHEFNTFRNILEQQQIWQ